MKVMMAYCVGRRLLHTYFQDMDQVESGGDFLQVKKQFYVQQIVNNTKTLVPLSAQKVKQATKSSRMVATTDRNLELALKDKRSAALEPVNQLSECLEGKYLLSHHQRCLHQYFSAFAQGNLCF